MDNSLKFSAIQLDALVEVLRRAGSRLITAETVTADFEAGAPRNDDGTINLIDFAAWLVKGEDANDDDQSE